MRAASARRGRSCAAACWQPLLPLLLALGIACWSAEAARELRPASAFNRLQRSEHAGAREIRLGEAPTDAAYELQQDAAAPEAAGGHRKLLAVSPGPNTLITFMTADPRGGCLAVGGGGNLVVNSPCNNGQGFMWIARRRPGDTLYYVVDPANQEFCWTAQPPTQESPVPTVNMQQCQGSDNQKFRLQGVLFTWAPIRVQGDGFIGSMCMSLADDGSLVSLRCNSASQRQLFVVNEVPMVRGPGGAPTAAMPPPFLGATPPWFSFSPPTGFDGGGGGGGGSAPWWQSPGSGAGSTPTPWWQSPGGSTPAPSTGSTPWWQTPGSTPAPSTDSSTPWWQTPGSTPAPSTNPSTPWWQTPGSTPAPSTDPSTPWWQTPGSTPAPSTDPSQSSTPWWQTPGSTPTPTPDSSTPWWQTSPGGSTPAPSTDPAQPWWMPPGSTPTPSPDVFGPSPPWWVTPGEPTPSPSPEPTGPSPPWWITPGDSSQSPSPSPEEPAGPSPPWWVTPGDDTSSPPLDPFAPSPPPDAGGEDGNSTGSPSLWWFSPDSPPLSPGEEDGNSTSPDSPPSEGDSPPSEDDGPAGPPPPPLQVPPIPAEIDIEDLPPEPPAPPDVPEAVIDAAVNEQVPATQAPRDSAAIGGGSPSSIFGPAPTADVQATPGTPQSAPVPAAATRSSGGAGYALLALLQAVAVAALLL